MGLLWSLASTGFDRAGCVALTPRIAHLDTPAAGQEHFNALGRPKQSLVNETISEFCGSPLLLAPFRDHDGGSRHGDHDLRYKEQYALPNVAPR